MSSVVNAIVLAGGSLEECLRPVVPLVKHKAWIPLGGRLMVERVLDALDGCRSRIGQRVLVARKEDVPPAILARVDRVAEPGSTLIQSVENGMRAVVDSSAPLLAIPCDMCFLEPGSIVDFLDRCVKRPAEVHYSYVRRETSESRYPGLRHTWVKMREGTFCGGGLFLLTSESVTRAQAFIDRMTVARKRPWKLAGILGPKIIFKLLLGMLSVRDAEERMSLLMQAETVGIESPCPDVGFNVDAPEELATARRLAEAGS